MTNEFSSHEMGWQFDNSYTNLPSSLFTPCKPTRVEAPELVVLNRTLAAELGLDVDALDSEKGASIFAGNRLPDGAEPLAQAYAGHQFGHLNLLGDGRAILLGEQLTPQGVRVDVQLKGAGQTPYSRRGDGRAALGPMLREYIISEAMHGLRIPTTRSLAVAATGETIYRETVLPGAVLTRIAASLLRVGTFQYAAHWKTEAELRALADYTLQRHYPALAADEQPYLRLLEAVIQRQAELIARWMLVGFIHGVMNTDNVALSGETIDYGPCAFMDAYDPATVFSSIDTQGRYAYGNQPYIGGWNLARFAEALLPLLHEDEEQAVQIAQDTIATYSAHYHQAWLSGMRAKLGLFGEEAEDSALAHDLLEAMKGHQADLTNTFVALTFGKPEDTPMHGSEQFDSWLKRWEERRSRQAETLEASQLLMRSSNPAIIPRNHRVEEALDAAVQHGDYTVMERLVAALKDPYAHRPEQEEYAEQPPKSACGYKTFCGT
ncbi:YdiU family protein [Paenibacillus oryzisoli]|uniref:protein adenylyltransferase SelO n=1 Tax=Paenibacillus oryzisoli TaxID=1850517 RepID=UPI003D2AAA95